MPTYSRMDYHRMADAISKNLADVLRHESEFERAATWYRINIPPAERKGPATSEVRKRPTKKTKTLSEQREERRKKPKTRSALEKQVKQVRAAAAKLLLHLGVRHSADASDGPGDRELLIFLASHSSANEEEIVRATARVGRLHELVEAVAASKSLKLWAAEAVAGSISFGKLITAGHRGEAAENEWIADMMSLYEKITRRKARTSVTPSGSSNSRKATGPLIRFLEAAGTPLGIEHSPESWRGRIRDNQTGGRRQK